MYAQGIRIAVQRSSNELQGAVNETEIDVCAMHFPRGANNAQIASCIRLPLQRSYAYASWLRRGSQTPRCG